MVAESDTLWFFYVPNPVERKGGVTLNSPVFLVATGIRVCADSQKPDDARQAQTK